MRQNSLHCNSGILRFRGVQRSTNQAPERKVPSLSRALSRCRKPLRTCPGWPWRHDKVMTPKLCLFRSWVVARRILQGRRLAGPQSLDSLSRGLQQQPPLAVRCRITHADGLGTKNGLFTGASERTVLLRVRRARSSAWWVGRETSMSSKSPLGGRDWSQLAAGHRPASVLFQTDAAVLAWFVRAARCLSEGAFSEVLFRHLRLPALIPHAGRGHGPRRAALRAGPSRAADRAGCLHA